MEGTSLAWIDFRWTGMDAPALERFMRDDARLILSEGYTFGEEGAGFERINLALPRAQLKRALTRLADAWDARK
ncbi:MAG: pyridoxal phosphate-dependent aminotransferase, partial [Eubacteriales bacterium]|nr:pyridoxal phosphate-dependent aminotransferase [Eubacteriales bacterium]